MASATARTMTADEADQAVQTIALAFAADPMTRWTWPNAQQFLAAMPKFVRAFGGDAFNHGGAHCTQDFAGAALWLPSGAHPNAEEMTELMRSTASPAIHEVGGSLFEQMASYHPREPHWYLPLIGVDPAHQGKGHGDTLMAYALALCDRDHLPAYLESSNPRNISLYRRHGFEPIGTIQAGSSPQIVPMLRQPR